MRNNRTAFFVVLLVSIFFLLGTGSVCGESPQTMEVYIEGVDVQATFSLDMWHYSGGYWKVGNAGSDKITIEDGAMLLRGFQGVLADEAAMFVVDLPTDVLDKIAQGKEVIAKVATLYTPLEKLFDTDSFEMSMSEDKLSFSAKPWFNLLQEQELSFADYGFNLPTEIPLIDRAYGYNIYSLFGNGESGAQSAGRINRLSPNAIESGYVHPAMITGLDGALEGGHTICIRGSAVGSAGYSVGNGTFAAGGAVGLSFSYPVKFQFYEVVEGEAPPPVITPPAITQTDVTAILDLPPETYEGHSVIAQDSSIFEVEDETIYATSAYEQNLAGNSFRIVESGAGRISRQSDTRAEVTFNTEGNFNVRLNVETASGQSSQDVKPIAVKRTPCLLHTLGGTQKQNRKQSLFVTVAQNPEYPIRQLWIELEDVQTGESVRLEHQTDGSQNTLFNNDTIKTRAIVKQGSTDFFLNVRLDFLTKNTENQDYIYRIYAEDSRGYTDNAEVLFPVEKDNPPAAEISIEPFFLRDQGSNTARITAEDVSITDGDQLERTWLYCPATQAAISLTDMPGYRDISFGTGKTIQFDKEGVGPFALALEVKDVWTEETLAEYILPSDYLSAETSAQSEVDNVAPVVSLKATRTQTANILLLAKDEISYNQALLGKAELSHLLLSEGIDASIQVEQLSASGQTVGGVTQNIGTLTVPYGFKGTWSGFWENGSFTLDEKQLYKAEATWVAGETVYDCYPAQPYTIRAYNAKTLEEKWTYTLSAERFPMGTDRGYDAFFGHDRQNCFLYFMINGKTVLLDKHTGAELVILPFSMGAENSVFGEYIFCFKDDGIYRVSMLDGSVTRIFAERIFAGPGKVKTIGGKEVFLVQRGTQLLRAAFDSKSQTLAFRALQSTEKDSGTAATYLSGIDSAGTFLINTVEERNAVPRAFDINGKLLYQDSASIVENFPDCLVPVYDSAGRINYIGIRTYRSSSSGKTVSVNLRGIYDSFNKTVSIKDEDGYPTEVDRVLFGLEKEDGTVLVGLGAQWTYIANSGYNNGPVHGMPQRAKVFKFNTATDQATEGSVSDFAAGLSSVAEYGCRAPGTILISTGANHQDVSQAYHSTSVISVSETEDSQINRLEFRYLSDDADNADYTLSTQVTGGFYPQTIADELLSRTEAGENVLVLNTETTDGSISKTFSVKPGKTYYYEYKTTAEEDILTATASYSRSAENSEAGTGRYAVKEEFFEDFNDSQLNPYFSLEAERVEGGQYTAAKVYLYQSSDWKNKYLESSSAIVFTVPEDINGILSFDYDIRRDSGWMSNFFTLSKDGEEAEIWDEFVSGSKKGSYTSKSLLEPGRYTLKAYARAYGGRIMNYYTKLDNLRMLFVDPLQTEEAPREETVMEAHSSIRPSGSANLVSGTFFAPPGVLYYSKLNAEYIEGGDSTAYSAVSGEPGRYRQTVNIPKGRTALYLDMDIWAAPTLTKNYNSVSFTWGENQWVCAYDNRYPQSALTNIPREYALTRMGLGGTQRVDQYSSTNRNAYGGFSEIRMVISNPEIIVPPSVEKGRFILTNEGLYFESTVFEGAANLSFCPEAIGETQISDLEIYTIENGTKVYLEDVSFSREAVLQSWGTVDAVAAVSGAKQEEEEGEAIVFAKGDLISYDIFYSDYEEDPSKESYWKYTHTPMNDGLHPMSGQVLSAPIDRFYVDGKYVLEHWQEDDASRTGNSSYDKASNVCVLTFYIEGAAQAPWITYIRTNPKNVEAGDSYLLQIGVDDAEKDALSLETELYHESRQGLPFYMHINPNLVADGFGRYPQTNIPIPYPAMAGRYDVVSTVRDATGAGLGTYRFTCMSPIGITGEVFHTPEWEENRRRYNVERFGDEGNAAVDFALYSAKSPPGLRGTNVFWPGERLCLAAQAGGSPVAVTAAMLENPEYTTSLLKSGPSDNFGKSPYAGFLWNETMLKTFAAAAPVLRTIRFTATYSDRSFATCDVEIIFDRNKGYWQLHRLY